MMTTARERPILFSAPMVRAILAGRKTQTRRIVKPQPTQPLAGHVIYSTDRSESGKWRFAANDNHDGEYIRCPYGLPHDRLWVRETWSPDHAAFYPNFSVIHRADGYDPRELGGDDDHPGQTYSPEQKSWYPFKWRPSIFMPREHCRIVLEIVNVRVERLQDITEEDAAAEGMYEFKLPTGSVWGSDPKGTPGPDIGGTACQAFRNLWHKINGTESWKANPWVWVVTFRKLETQP